MTVSPAEIDGIVREVLARLGAGASACASEPQAAEKHEPAGDESTLCVQSAVVTLADVGPRLGRLRRVVVPPGAVVTPAARDALRDREIALCYGPDASAASSLGEGLPLVVALCSFDPAPVVEALAREGLVVQPSRSDCLIETFDRLAQWAGRGGTLGVVLTPEVAAALCLGNRLAGVRAVAARDEDSAVASARSVGANVLVACPRGVAPHRLARLIARFVAAGPYRCPEALWERLR